MFRSIFFISLLLFPAFGFSQHYKAVSISLAEGLSQSSVYSIIQDHEGFTWMATQDGLNKYDGTGFYVYRDEPFDSNSISSNYINDLLCDSKGRIWIATANHGLNLKLPGKENFLRFKAGTHPGALTNNIITDLYQDPNGTLWVGNGNGLHRIIETVENGNAVFRFEKIELNISNEDTTTDRYVTEMISDNKNQLWVGTYSGLFRVRTSNHSITSNDIAYYSKSNNTISDFIIHTLAIDKLGRIWAGNRNGIDILNPDGVKLKTLSSQNETDLNMAGRHVSSLMKASNGDMWIGYFENEIQFVKSENVDSKIHFETPHISSKKPYQVGGNAISIWEDQITKGIIWVGFYAGGAVRLVPVTKRFHTNHLTDAPLTSSFVVSLLKEDADILWIGTHQGLLKYNRKTKVYTPYLPSQIDKKPYNENYISGLVFSREGDVLFGSGTRLYKITNENGKEKIKKILLPDGNGMMRSNLRTIVSDRSGNIYLVCRYNVYRFDSKTESIIPHISITDPVVLNDKGYFIGSYFVDKNGNHWLGTSGGLEFYAKESGKSSPNFQTSVSFRHEPMDTSSLRNQNILCFAEDKNDNLWLGTMNGLTRVMNENGTKRFLNYSTKNGLKNNVIYSILPDEKTGNLWLSTNNGLTEFDPTGRAVATYDVHDGLQSNEFNSYAGFLADDGEMLFGGIDGYTTFYPEQILRDTSLPLISISNMVLNDNRTINLSDYQQSKAIELKYQENSFTINFAGLHYADPQKNRYAYMLEGFQSDWTYAGNSRSVNFSQLPPGSYKFRVKVANSDGLYNEAGDMFVITILPPFYKTIWFYLIIAVLIAGIVYGLFKYRLSMKMEQVKEVEKIRRATAADFHDELGHKLTIISWFAEILKKKIGNDQVELRPHLDKIIEASGNLYHTMKDMLWAMDPDKDSVYDLYNQIREFGMELFDSTGIEFEAGNVSGNLKDNIISPAHKRHVLLIFKEVMHNSLKHAHGNATALDLIANGSSIKFRFRDNGTGFKMNGHNVGRGLENVKRRAKHINAKIDIHSEDSGTVAELDLFMEHLN